MAVQINNRRYDLDWLRVIAFSILILFHSGMMFNTWDWHVKNNVTTDMPEILMYFLHLWRMPLLFLISGVAVYMILQKFSMLKFLKNRMTRIFLPLVFGLFVIIPPQVYYERLFHGQTFNSFFEFYKTIFDFVPYPKGNFSWHHLWYLPYIFTFSLVMLPVFKFLQSEKGSILLRNIVDRFCKTGMILLWFIPLGISQVILRPFWPNDNHSLFADWSNFSWSLLFFIYGFILVSHKNVWDSIEQFRYKSLFIGILSIAVLVFFLESFQHMPEFDRAMFRMLRALQSWSMILTILGFARKYLQRNSSILQYANEAVYPFYILHQTITVVLAYYLASWQIDIFAKFLIVCAGTLIGCWTLYEGVIKRNAIVRVLFGMKLARYEEVRSPAIEPVMVANETVS